mmetsp:Transcript_135896/g.260964  ORF Transcript_135896/g.260964 Transcript_135896/m.260964 type:complete len:81 (-) Transcript_135896:461-703(-)
MLYHNSVTLPKCEATCVSKMWANEGSLKLNKNIVCILVIQTHDVIYQNAGIYTPGMAVYQATDTAVCCQSWLATKKKATE